LASISWAPSSLSYRPSPITACTTTMVNHPLPLIMPRQSPSSPSGASPQQAADTQQHSIKGSLTIIGNLLSQPAHNTILSIGRARQSMPFRHHTSHAVSTSSAAYSSPVRTRKSVQTAAQQQYGPSPQHGMKTKMRRVEGGSTTA
jgi:hypothetical protein